MVTRSLPDGLTALPGGAGDPWTCAPLGEAALPRTGPGKRLRGPVSSGTELYNETWCYLCTLLNTLLLRLPV